MFGQSGHWTQISHKHRFSALVQGFWPDRTLTTAIFREEETMPSIAKITLPLALLCITPGLLRKTPPCAP